MNAGTENANQEALIQWCETMSSRYPELKLIYHVPNEGKRDVWYTMALKRRGMKTGVPDLCLPVARRGYHGLYIELKVGKNKPTRAQALWLEELNCQGYLATVCYGWEEAAKCIEDYLKGGKQ